MPSGMKVTHLIDGLAKGGAETLEVTFAAEAQQRPINLTVIGLHDRQPLPTYVEQLRGLGATVRVLRPPCEIAPRRRLRDVVELAEMLTADGTEVLHTSLIHANILGVAAGRLARVPVVSSLHGTLDDTGRHRRHVRLLETTALRWGAQRVIAVGRSVAEEHAARLGGRQIDVVPNAVRPAVRLTSAARDRMRLSFGIGPSAPLLLTVGRLTPEKGQDVLLSAFATVVQRHPTCRLLLVGDGPLLPALREQAAALGVEDAVRLVGQRDDVPSLLKTADVFVSASLYEGLPLAVLEAMAAGLPVVATSVGEVPTLLGDGRGVVVPPSSPTALGTAVSELLDQPGRLAQLRGAGPAYIEHNHSSAAWADRLMAIYHEVRDNRRTTS